MKVVNLKDEKPSELFRDQSIICDLYAKTFRTVAVRTLHGMASKWVMNG